MKEKIQKYVRALIHNAINLQEGQYLLITAPIEVSEFVQELVSAAYEAHARYVYVQYSDPVIDQIRFTKSDDAYLDEFSTATNHFQVQLAKENTAFLRINGGSHDLFADIDPSVMTRVQRATAKSMKDFTSYSRNGSIATCGTVIPTLSWAKKVFPNDEGEVALAKLWDKFFAIGKVEAEDTIQAWHDHVSRIASRRDYLNEKQFQKLCFKSSLVDFELELNPSHIWVGGQETTKNGVSYMPNFPTEEIFNCPNKFSINGTVHNSLPLVYQNKIIDDFTLTFENGKITKAIAHVGQEYLDELLGYDEGTRYIGEIALLGGETEISKTNTIYYNTLLDENAACHMAIGCAYLCNTENEVVMTPESYAPFHMNFSMIHVDFMFGSKDITVTASNEAETAVLIQDGVWMI